MLQPRPNKIFLDQLHRQVQILSPPKRIISLVPSQTELLFTLGLDKEVVGITKFCVHPREQFKSKPKIGGTKQVKPDVIHQLQPDLIIANKEENDREQVEKLAQQFPVWVSDIHNLEDALKMINAIGEITSTVASANRIVTNINQGFSKLHTLQQHPISCAYLIWNNPWMVAGGDTFINNMLEKAGFQNVFSNLKRYPEISKKQLQAAAPEAILLSSEPFPFREKHFQGFAEVCPDAVINLVDGELFSWYGSRLLHSASYFLNLASEIRKSGKNELV